MRNVYTCIDLGSRTIKLVTMEKVENKFIVLSRVTEKSKGIKKGIITNEEDAILSIKKAISKSEKDLGLKIKSLLCLIPGYSAEFSIEETEIEIFNDVGKGEITKALQKIAKSKMSKEKVLVNIEPISYELDGIERKSVLGENGEKLIMKAIVSEVDKRHLKPIFDLFKKMNLELIDIGFTTMGDYEVYDNKDKENNTVAIVNIGYDKTEIGIVNKSAMIKTDVLNVGSKSLDKDISYIYNLDRGIAHSLTRNFSVSCSRFADSSEITSVINKNNDVIKLNQSEVTEVVEARLVEILRQAKKQINILTNKEIRYIIVTGGISEIIGFDFLVDNICGGNATVLQINMMGVRDNKYSACVGFIEYFSRKLLTRGTAYSMYNIDELNMIARKKNKTTSESGLGGIINYFTGNKED